MNKVQFISNGSKQSHLKYILDCFHEAEEIWLATAFLKMSGLTLILSAIKKHVKKGYPITIIAGQNFGLTDPEALKTLFSLFKKYPRAQLFLDNANEVFHPKLSLTKNKKSCRILSGSANITAGGLQTNQEASFLIQITSKSQEWIDASNYFQSLIKEDNASLVTERIINNYEQYYKTEKKTRAQQKHRATKRPHEYSYDIEVLKEHLDYYKNEEYRDALKLRNRNYNKAKNLLNEISDTSRISKKRFSDIIDELVGKAGQKGLWKSGSLYRKRRNVYNHLKEFKSLVDVIRNGNKKSGSDLFEECKELVTHISGARVNYVTEILMTYYPKKYANLNSNPITVLKEEVGVYIKSHSDSFSGEDYQQYCQIMKEICEELELESMLEADSFFNEIYWELKEGK